MAEMLGTSHHDAGRGDYNPHKSGQPLPKRMRTSNACEQCRLKKIRCNGRRPVCSSCQEMCRPCSYNHIPKKRGLPPGYHASLERRTQALEATCALYYDRYGDTDDFMSFLRSRSSNHSAEMEPQGTHNSSTIFSKWRSSSLYWQIEGMVTNRNGFDLSQGVLQLPPETFGSLATEKASADRSMTSDEGSTLQSSEDFMSNPTSDYPGAISTQGLAEEEVQHQPQRSTTSQNTARKSLSSPENSLAASNEVPAEDSPWNSSQNIPKLSIPPAPTLLANTEELLDIYFAFTHLWLPLVDKYRILSTFRRYPQTESISKSSGLPDSAEIALLWAILAYTSFQCSSLGPRQNTVSPKAVYCTARKLIPDGEDGFRIEHVQALTLLSLTCLGNGSTSASWVLIGTARRIATDLGLSYIEAIETSQSSHRRRTFAACSVIEILVAAQLGRGSSLHELYCDGGTEAGISPASTSYPLAIEEEGWEEWDTWAGYHLAIDDLSLRGCNRGPTRAITVFNKLLQLTRILRNILYFGRNSIPPMTRAIVRTKIFNQLSSWKADSELSQDRSESALPHKLHLKIWYVSVCDIFQDTFSTAIDSAIDENTLSPVQSLEELFDCYKSAYGLQMAPPTFPFFVYVALSGNPGAESILVEHLSEIERTWSAASGYHDRLERGILFGRGSMIRSDEANISELGQLYTNKAFLTTFPAQLSRICSDGVNQRDTAADDRSSGRLSQTRTATDRSKRFKPRDVFHDATVEQQVISSFSPGCITRPPELRDTTARSIPAGISTFNIGDLPHDPLQTRRNANDSNGAVNLSGTRDTCNTGIVSSSALDDRLITLDEVDWYESVARITSFIFPNKAKAG